MVSSDRDVVGLLGLDEGGFAIRRYQLDDEIAFRTVCTVDIIGKLGSQTNDVRDLDEPARGIVVEGGGAAEGVGDFGDLVNVSLADARRKSW